MDTLIKNTMNQTDEIASQVSVYATKPYNLSSFRRTHMAEGGN